MVQLAFIKRTAADLEAECEKEQEMDPVPSDWFLKGIRSINVQPYCCVLDIDDLLLFSNGPRC